ncbi:MAG: DUF2169 domain-containing protein [Deltaproteobacteria bacterium]|nr:DUF2169 domain-containing protein [Deltaproteobacteria bacterium]
MTLNPIAQVPRLVVVQPRTPSGVADRWLPVGVTTSRAEAPRLTVVVKMTLSFRQSSKATGPVRARLAADQLPLSLDEPSLAFDARPDELHYASDFAPRKAAADVLVVGHAHPAEPVRHFTGSVTLGELERRFAVQCEEPLPAIALACSSLVPGDDGEPVPLGPTQPPGHDDTWHGEDFDYACYNAAHPLQRTDSIDPSAPLRLIGLSRHCSERFIKLPGLAPQAWVNDRFRGVRPVELTADTLWLDVDRELAVLVWRGDVEVIENGSELERIVVSLDRAERPRSHEQVLPLLQRGQVAYAARPVDLEPGADPIPTDDDVLRLHRYKTWRSRAPQPEISIEQYATISAELAECATPEERRDVMECHGFDEDGWTIEERAWLEKMAQGALDGDARLAAVYSDLFVRAQDELAQANEAKRTFAEYLDIAEAMAQTAEPQKALADFGLTLPMWMRLDRRCRAEMTDDGELEARYRERMGQLKAAPPPMPEDPS